MLEPPNIEDAAIVACVREAFGLDVGVLQFLPLGYDAQASVYRATTATGDLFVKLKRGGVEPAALEVPRALRDAGMVEVVAPYRTRDGDGAARLDDYAVLVYPFVDGESAMAVGMSPEQWRAYGASVARIHAARLPPQVAALVTRDDFAPAVYGIVLALDQRVKAGMWTDAIRQATARFWAEQRGPISALVAAAQALGATLQQRAPEMVLCHADIHAANVLVDRAGGLHVVDWDQPAFAPRERDLMFVVGSVVSHVVTPAEEAAFFAGYGDVTVDPVGLAYYRTVWALQDIGEFGEQIFGRPDIGAVTLADAARMLRGQFDPGGMVESAQAAITQVGRAEA